MLTIRLQRVGKKNQAAFRIVLAEKQRAVKKLAVEILGHYNPRSKEFGLKDKERIKYWLGQHVEVSPTVHNLFVEKGLLAGEKKSAWRPKIKEKGEEEAKAETVKASAEGGEAKSESVETPAEFDTAKKPEIPATSAPQEAKPQPEKPADAPKAAEVKAPKRAETEN